MAAAHEPTEKTRLLVTEFTRAGITQEYICNRIGVSENTLRKHYKYELENATQEAIVEVANNLYRMATGDGRSALGASIFFLKTRARWRENDPGSGGSAPPLEIRLVDSTAEQLRSREQAVEN